MLVAIVSMTLLWLPSTASTPAASSDVQPPTITAGVTGWQRGFAFYDRPEAYGAPETLTSLKRLKATGANYVAPVVTWYVDNKWGSTVHRDGATPTDEQLSAFIQRAHSVGLRVLLTPHVDAKDNTWRGFLAPTDVHAWFASYEAMMIHYAELAATQRAEGLVVGQELVSLSGPAHTADWTSVICKVRSRYQGFLTYSANWGGGIAQFMTDPLEEFTKIQFWDYLDALGISAYFELSQSYDPSVGDLEKGWDTWNKSRIAPFQAQHQMPLLFTEVGYRSIAGAAAHPWDQNLPGGISMQAQANLYNAFFSYWSRVPWVMGVHIWNWEASMNAGGPKDGGYTPQNKPAEQVIASWYSLRGLWASESSAPIILPTRVNASGRCGGPVYVSAPGEGVRDKS